MANLIITIIAIALVAIAALMGAYYGGNAFRGGQDKARANIVFNQSSQIQMAIQMHEVTGGTWSNDNGTVNIISDLKNGTGTVPSLTTIPAIDNIAWELTRNAGVFNIALTTYFITTDICNHLSGHVGIIDGTGAWCCNEDAVQCNNHNIEFSF